MIEYIWEWRALVRRDSWYSLESRDMSSLLQCHPAGHVACGSSSSVSFEASSARPRIHSRCIQKEKKVLATVSGGIAAAASGGGVICGGRLPDLDGRSWTCSGLLSSATGNTPSFYNFFSSGEIGSRRGNNNNNIKSGFQKGWMEKTLLQARERRRFSCLASTEDEEGGVVSAVDYGVSEEGLSDTTTTTTNNNKTVGGGLGRVWGELLEPICPELPRDPHKSLINEDFAPALPEQRSFSIWDLASLWVGLVVGVPTYYMAGSLVDMGMAWWQGILTVVAGNVIVLLPMVLSGHGGTKYGIPFPVLSRAAFGIRGANVPSLLRALVGCGWFGIQTWIGGQAIFQLVNALLPTKMEAAVLPWLGTSIPELGCFLLFWGMQMCIIWNGIESIRDMEKYCAPILIVLSSALLGWAFLRAGGFGPMLSAPSQFVAGGAKEGQFWKTFFPALTANVGFWATLSLNIPDFTRYARSQSDQLLGQAVGLPLSMAAFTFVGLAVTSATVVIFGRVISDPIEVLSLIGSVVPTILALVGVILATLTTNIAANVVAPANAVVNINPTAFSFRKAGLLTATLSIVLGPWRLIQSSEGFIFTWLIGYSALLGPVGGIMITDYFLLRNRQLDISGLYSTDLQGQYWYTRGFNLKAMAALLLGMLPNVPGFLQSAHLVDKVPLFFSLIYDNSWFVGFLVSSVVYWLLSSNPKHRTSLSLA